MARVLTEIGYSSAANFSNVNAIRVLEEFGANISFPDNGGDTLVCVAARRAM